MFKKKNPHLSLVNLPWLVTYLGLVEHHLLGRELGHDVAAAAGAQRTKACDRSSAPAYYMHDSGHAFLPDSHNKDTAKCAHCCNTNKVCRKVPAGVPVRVGVRYNACCQTVDRKD